MIKEYKEILNEEGDWVIGDPTNIGQVYRKVINLGNGNKGFVQSTYGGDSPYKEEDIYPLSNITVTISQEGQKELPKENLYQIPLKTTFKIQASILDETGTLKEDMDYILLGIPEKLYLPFTKYAGGVFGQILDEVYLLTNLKKGIFIVEGDLPSSGNWILTEDRINKSLKAVGIDWKISSKNLNVIVN